ncbi:MAG: radical SAM protein [Candidatus Alcyoniella australis]|nr:radical SAM protein [Candidatus Alcyoniella australis]
MENERKIIPYRFEHFGGILHLEHPSSLIWVDKDYMRSLGFEHSPLWDIDRPYLCAPTEVHLSVTGRCSAGCVGCYMDARPDFEGDLDLEQMRKVIDTLADMRVFHLAMGGGESFECEHFIELARHARQRGMVPNVTTNGMLIDEHNAELSRVFGQINVSVDGVEQVFTSCRGHDGFARADRAINALRRAGCRVGINTVVSRRNFDHLEQLIRYAHDQQVLEVELLRFKPAGRGCDVFNDFDLTPQQARDFYPLITSLARRHNVWIKLDCSFTPLVCYHQPDPERMDFFAVNGCEAGNMLMGVRSDGQVSACSFSQSEPHDVLKMSSWWKDAASFSDFRLWDKAAVPEPCASCRYLRICRGGCHPVAQFVYGDFSMPDPGCPTVQEYMGSPIIH